MDELGRRKGFGRLVLRGLAITSALGFLALVMLQARAFYARSPKPEAPHPQLLGPATKTGPVVRPPPLDESEAEAPAYDRRLLIGETKAGPVFRPELILKPAPPPQRRGTTPPRDRR